MDATERLCGERPANAADRDRLGDAFVLGAWHGAWTMALGVLPACALYFARYCVLDLPWAVLAIKVASFAPACGAFYGAGVAVGDAAGRALHSGGAPPPRLALRARTPPECARYASARELRADACANRGLTRSASGVILPAMGGAIFGLAPGAFAADHLGRLAAPYFGTVEILATGALSFFLFGATIFARRGRVAWSAMGALVLALVLALALGFGVWAIAPGALFVADSIVLGSASLAPNLALFGAACGAIIGAFFGALLGVARQVFAIAEDRARGRA